MVSKQYKWVSAGDVNAFFGLMLDNIADLLLTVGLLHAVFGFPVTFALGHMVPGTALGVLVGDLLFFALAIRVGRKLGKPDLTAMPLGLDTPSTFGMVFFVLGPAFLAASQTMDVEQAAIYTWHIGICSIVISGFFKLACALISGWIRAAVPRAALLGSLAAIALVLISFLPILEVFHHPIVGLVSLSIILTTLVARVPFPRLPLIGHLPGALGAALVSGLMFYLLKWTGADVLLSSTGDAPMIDPSTALLPTDWLTVFRFEWLSRLGDSMQYMPVVIPFALATVVGGIDCTESAASAGDEFDTKTVIGIEAIATLCAGLCGGVIQTTPYIGHPAYKAMGGRAGYVLATALFVGGAGLFGYFGYLYAIIPKATVFPILIFVGLEITAQTFRVTKRAHYPAIVLACVPALAALVILYVDKLMGELAVVAYQTADGQVANVSIATLSATLQEEISTVRILSSGFIVTSVLWASALVALIDRKLARAGTIFAFGSVCVLFGLMHSPLPGGPVYLPWTLEPDAWETVIRYAGGYGVVAVMLWVWSLGVSPLPSASSDSHESSHHDEH